MPTPASTVDRLAAVLDGHPAEDLVLNSPKGTALRVGCPAHLVEQAKVEAELL